MLQQATYIVPKTGLGITESGTCTPLALSRWIVKEALSLSHFIPIGDVVRYVFILIRGETFSTGTPFTASSNN